MLPFCSTDWKVLRRTNGERLYRGWKYHQLHQSYIVRVDSRRKLRKISEWVPVTGRPRGWSPEKKEKTMCGAWVWGNGVRTLSTGLKGGGVLHKPRPRGPGCSAGGVSVRSKYLLQWNEDDTCPNQQSQRVHKWGLKIEICCSGFNSDGILGLYLFH